MYMLPIALLFTVIFARVSTTYDSRYSNGKYIVVKNNALAKLLIEKESFLGKGKRTLQKDRNKMSVIGLVFYLCNLFVVIMTAVLLLLPQIPCAPLVIDAKLYFFADTVNTKVPVVVTVILLCVEFLHFAILMFRDTKEIEGKWVRTLIRMVSVLLFMVCSVVIIEMAFELFR